MKKVLFALLLSFVLLFSFSCASTSLSTTDGGSPKKKARTSGGEYADAPEWYGDMGSFYRDYGMDVIVGVGTGKKSNTDLSRRAANADALRYISGQMSSMVEDMYKEFLEEKGYDPDRTLEKTTAVTKVITEANIKGAKIVKQYVSPSGRAYVAYIVDQQAALRNALDASRGAVRADELYADFQSENAFDELDEELSKRKQKFTPITEE